MACAALKRPYNFDILSQNAAQLNSSSPKRQRCGTVAVASTSSNVSPFLSATPKLSREDLAKNVQEEWCRYRCRKKCISPSSPPNSMQFQQCTSLYWNGSSSNTSSISMSPPRSPNGSDSPSLKIKQVVLLCERLWKEREEKLREEYDQVLNEKLAEQYESFLKFTQDQIMRKYQHSSYSYVS
ncbi:akirin-2 isoform X2 [Hydra vulgaris]|uniref:Akirin-2 isoform X2 n=1 Tax=Hydra vulgaris TaxID=6087 RepID=A0ABM4BJ43_HYDVU